MKPRPQIPNIEEIFRLAQEQPDVLEKLHKQWIEELIESAPEQQQRRLRGLQWEIDAEMSKHDNPMGKCVAISKMMMESLSELNKALHGELPPSRTGDAPKAKVINIHNKIT